MPTLRTLFLFAFLASQANSTPQSSCNPDPSAEIVEVTRVIDGDTVILRDGRHIRLIGINAPEIGHNGKISEPGADAARKHLLLLLQGHKRILLKTDIQQFDRHKRTLAHLFLADGKNIQASLLAKGLATPLTIPPNLNYLDCYHHHSDQAMVSQQGLWYLQQYKPLASTNLDKSIQGYRVITGKVERINESRLSRWINLTGNTTLRIKRNDLDYFNESDLHTMKGKMIQVRGWVYHKNKEFRINLKHPSDIIFIR